MRREIGRRDKTTREVGGRVEETVKRRGKRLPRKRGQEMRRLIFLNAIEQVNNDEVNDEVNDEGNDEVNVLHFYIFLGRSEIEYFS